MQLACAGKDAGMCVPSVLLHAASAVVIVRPADSGTAPRGCAQAERMRNPDATDVLPGLTAPVRLR
jgi:hypothetical protein